MVIAVTVIAMTIIIIIIIIIIKGVTIRILIINIRILIMIMVTFLPVTIRSVCWSTITCQWRCDRTAEYHYEIFPNYSKIL